MQSLLKYLLFAFLFISQVHLKAYSQCYLNTGEASKFSLEAGAGLLLPISPSTKNFSFGDAAKFEFGLRYLPENKNLGFRAFYSYSSLSDNYIIPNDTIDGKLKLHRLELQVIYMLDEALNISRNSAFELESYLGIGGAFGKGDYVKGTNNMLSISLGLRPRYQIAPKLHLYLDASYALQINQQMDYAGHILPNAKKGNLGSMTQLSLGLSYRL